MIEAVITWKDGNKSTVYAADFPELFAKMGHDQVLAVEACTLDLKNMKQGKERSKTNENHLHVI